MPIASGVAIIIGAVIAAGSSIVGTAVNNSQVDEYNEMGMKLANLKRQDVLKLQAEQKKMDKWTRKQREEEFGFQRSEARKSRKERKGVREHGKRQQSMANTINMVNQNPATRSVFMDIMTRRGGK